MTSTTALRVATRDLHYNDDNLLYLYCYPFSFAKRKIVRQSPKIWREEEGKCLAGCFFVSVLLLLHFIQSRSNRPREGKMTVTGHGHYDRQSISS